MLKKWFAVLMMFSFINGYAFSQNTGEEPVMIKITVIKASNNNEGVDYELKNLTSQLERLNYSSYKFINQDHKEGRANDEIYFSLPDGDTLKVVPLPTDEGYVKLFVKMEKAGLNTNFRISNYGTVIVGGNKYKDGSLVIAISANY